MLSNEQFHYVIDIVNSNDNLVEHDYKGKENQVLVSKELTDKIIDFTKDIKEEAEDLKDTVKMIMRRVFNLCETDLVLFKNGSIFIKLFAEDIQKVLHEKVTTPVAKRYNGVDEEELIAFHEDFFKDNEHKDFFLSIAQEFIEKYFNGQRISNDEYEKNVFGYILNITFEHLVSLYDNSDGFFTGFAGYIFRIHFNEVFEYIADIMLEKVSLGSEFMVKFLDYYSAGIIVSEGNKYQVPIIKTDSGLRWTVVSMLSIAKIYSKTITSIKDLNERKIDDEDDIYELYIDDLSPLEYHTNFLHLKREIENDIINTTKNIDKYSDALILEKDVEKAQTLKVEIMSLKDELLSLTEEQNELLAREIDRNILKEYVDLQKDLDSIKRQLQRADRIIIQNEESYFSLRDALVKALTSKKKQLKE